MKNLSTHRVIHSPSCQFTRGVILALTLFSLTVNAQDLLDPNATVVRYNSNGEITASGDDIGTVQTTTGAAEGDVIKVSDGAVFNTDVIDPVNNFIVESSTGNVVNVPVQAMYYFPQTPAAPVNAAFRNVSFTGAENYISCFWSGVTGTLACNNVTFADFNASVFNVIGDIQGKVSFVGNHSEGSGGAIAFINELSGNNNQLTFSKNTANGTDASAFRYGGAIGYLSDLSGSGNTLEFSENTAHNGGGAIWQLSNLSGSGNKLTFSKNTVNGDTDGGGAIGYLSDLSGSGNILEFSENTANTGGAIRIFTDSAGNNNTLKFSGNTARSAGGAIFRLYDFSGSGNTLTFTGNTAEYFGGAIYEITNFSGSGNILDFSENTAAKGGGAIMNLTNLSGENNTLKFTGNTSEDGGGAIYRLNSLTGSGNTLIFSGNTAEEGNGGAIWNLTHFSGENNKLTFTGNSAKYGGAIGYFVGLSGSNNTLTFTGNTARVLGGAIYSINSIEFNGNNSLTFTGNKAGAKGNDIYINGSDTSPANLTFRDGTYSFDGGIWLAEYNGQTGTTTISNGANVTIAGRNDDSVNEYEFRNVALTANLTATVDDIEYLHGNFTVGENGLMTINKGSDKATIKSSSNDGVFDLLINKAENVETISISSGRIDIKGCIDATIELQNDAELQSVASFSPGNSAGKLETTGDFIATAGSLLIFEQEGDVYDQLIANNVTIDPETGIDLSLFTTFAPGAVYDIIIANGTLSVDQSWIDMIQSGLPEFVEASIYNGNTVRLKIDANAVPEPSTWALLVLGAAGLAYMRKRSRQ